MKKQHLVALGVVLLAVLALRFMLSARGRDVATDLSATGVVKVVEGLDADAVTFIRAAAAPATPAEGAEPAPSRAPLRLDKRDGRWLVTSAHGAPAEPEVATFVSEVATLSGEVRGKGASVFAEFGVDEASAVAVELGTGEKTALKLFVGKQGDAATSHFVRKDGDDRVFHVRAELGRMLGTFTPGEAPPPDHWVEKLVLDLPVEGLSKVEVERPDGRFVYERGAPPPPPSPDAGEAPAAEAKWVVSEPVLPWPAKDNGVGGAVERMARVRVASVLDPSAPECPRDGAPAPGGTITFTETSGSTRRVLLGGSVTSSTGGTDEVALRVEGAQPCYALARWSVGSLLPSVSSLADVPAAFPDAPEDEEVSTVSVAGGAGAFSVRRKDDGWIFERGGTGPAASSPVTGLVSALLRLRVEDVVPEASVPAGAKSTWATVTAEAKGGRRLVVTLLGTRPASTQRYVRVAGLPAGWLGVVSDYTSEALAPSPETLKDQGPS